MPHSNHHQSEDEADRQARALGIFFRRKFKKASFGEIATLLTNLVLIVVGISAAGIYGCQLNELRRANDLTRQSIHASGRAWVGIEKMTPNSFDRGSAEFVLGVTFTLRNYGHSAAHHVRIFPQLGVANSSTITTGICDDSKAGKYVGDVILPEQKRDYPEAVNVTVADMESALKQQNPAMGRNLMLILRGCVEYMDDPTEKTPHHTPFSYFITRSGNERLFTPDLQSVPGPEVVLSPASIYPGPTD